MPHSARIVWQGKREGDGGRAGISQNKVHGFYISLWLRKSEINISEHLALPSVFEMGDISFSPRQLPPRRHIDAESQII